MSFDSKGFAADFPVEYALPIKNAVEYSSFDFAICMFSDEAFGEDTAEDVGVTIFGGVGGVEVDFVGPGDTIVDFGVVTVVVTGAGLVTAEGAGVGSVLFTFFFPFGDCVFVDLGLDTFFDGVVGAGDCIVDFGVVGMVVAGAGLVTFVGGIGTVVAGLVTLGLTVGEDFGIG